MTDNDQAQLEAAVMELVEERDQEIGRHGVDLAEAPRLHAQRIIERVDEMRAEHGTARAEQADAERERDMRVLTAIDENSLTKPGVATLHEAADYAGMLVEDTAHALERLLARGYLERMPGVVGAGEPQRYRICADVVLG